MNKLIRKEWACFFILPESYQNESNNTAREDVT